MSLQQRRFHFVSLCCGIVLIGSVAGSAFAQQVVIVPSSKDLAAKELQRTVDLSAKLRSQDASTQLEAIHAIANSPNQAIQLSTQLIALTTASDVNIRLASVTALQRVHTSELIAPIETCLRMALDDHDPRVRVSAIHTLGTRETIIQATADRLAALIQDENGDVQFAVLHLLLRCPELRKQLLPKVIPLLSSKAMRTQSISIDFSTQTPVAWDAARVVYFENVHSARHLNQQIKELIAHAVDPRIKFILALSIDPEAEPSGLVFQMISEAAHREDPVEQRAIHDELYELPLSHVTKLRLLLKISKFDTEIGDESAQSFIGENYLWSLIVEDLMKASQDEEVREWLKAAIREWLAGFEE